jgi:hypothetical protein
MRIGMNGIINTKKNGKKVRIGFANNRRKRYPIKLRILRKVIQLDLSRQRRP